MKKQTSFYESSPTLYVVATPIGNLTDMTIRAIEILRSVDFVLAEDTRNSKVLLDYYGIVTKLVSYHDHNKDMRHQVIIDWLKAGKSLALISDAGTPGIADPGFELVKVIVTAGYQVVPIPGVSALTTLISVSDLVTLPFTFLGFLPKQVGDIEQLFNNYQDFDVTLAFYESPQRIRKTIKYLQGKYPHGKVCIGRELTKKFETIIWSDLADISIDDLDYRGEYTIILKTNTIKVRPKDSEIITSINEHIEAGNLPNEAIKQVAKQLGLAKNQVYNLFIKSKERNPR